MADDIEMEMDRPKLSDDNNNNNNNNTEEYKDDDGDHGVHGGHGDGDENVLKFMDSLDAYLSLFDSLSSTLRQGWFDFASARHSMGAWRVNSALLDMKEHPAATSLQVSGGEAEEPHFTLCKWAYSTDINGDDDGLQLKSNEVKNAAEVDGLSVTADDNVQKERSKSLAVFGTLVSPKLRAAQLSFETALETLVELANMRASMLSAFDQVQERVDGVKKYGSS